MFQAQHEAPYPCLLVYPCPQVLQQKLAQLELAWAQKEKFVQSNRMIVRFREDHIARLEQKLNSEPLLDQQNQTQLEQLQQEISILRDQVPHTALH